MGKKKEIIRLERESVIPVLKPKMVTTFANLIDSKSERDEFLKFCKRVEYTIRAWYHLQFDDLMQLYSLFDPIHGAKKLEKQNLTPEEIDTLEYNFLNDLFQIMNKSNFKLTTDAEIQIALSGQYRLNLPIKVDEAKLDKRLFRRYFAKQPHPDLPDFADKFIIFRRGIGTDQMSAYFINAKINTILRRWWKCFLRVTGLKRCFGKKTRGNCMKNDTQLNEISIEAEQDGIHVERIRIEKMRFRVVLNLLSKITIQEPTFDRIIVVYRRSSTKKQMERGIYVKHFKHIPMADMEIVLPEKKNPSLTPMDWVKFLVSAAIGLGAVISSLTKANSKAGLRVIFAIVMAVSSYCVKTYFTFQKNMVSYQSLITQSVYDKQLDSGRGTLLHLCDEVIQQEVKEVIIAYFVLMEQGKSSRKDLDIRCEKLINEEFGEKCNFDVDDAVQKLAKLGIISIDGTRKYSCVGLHEANEIIGTTTEEVVLKAKQQGSQAPLADEKTKHDDDEEQRYEDEEQQYDDDNDEEMYLQSALKRNPQWKLLSPVMQELNFHNADKD